MNQSRPRALACGDALAVAGAVCFNVASDGRPTSARRSSRPPSNSSASVDSPLPPAPSGNYGVGVWPNAPRTRPPLSARIPPPSTRRKEYRSVLAGTQICERGYFEKHCEFRKQRAPWNKVPKFRNPCARRNARWLNYGSDSFALFLVSQRWARSATTVRRSGGPWDARSRPRWLTPSLNPPRAWLCGQFTSARGFRRWP